MNNYSFVEIHLKTPRVVWCEICDHEAKEVTKYYEYEVVHMFPDGAVPMHHRALECCIKHGNVVDWREE